MCSSKHVYWKSGSDSSLKFVWSISQLYVIFLVPILVYLLYFQSIENAPELEELLPPKGGPSFTYSGEDGAENTELCALSAKFNSMVRARKTVQQLISWIEESIIPAHGSKVAVEVVIQTLLDIGSKSFTHLITVLERYGQIIAKLCPDHDGQILLIGEVSSYWKNSTQMMATTIDRMMGYRLVSNLAIIRWVFSLPNVDQFHLSDRPWEVSSLRSC